MRRAANDALAGASAAQYHNMQCLESMVLTLGMLREPLRRVNHIHRLALILNSKKIHPKQNP